MSQLQDAIRLHQAGQLDQAAERYRRILAADPRQSEALHLLGVIAQQQGRTAEALELITRALQIQPNNAVYHSNLALTLRAAKRAPEALEHLRTAVRLDANYLPARRNLAIVLQDGGQLRDAAEQWQGVVQRNPRDAVAWRRLGLALLMQGRPAEAERNLRQALELQPTDADAAANLGVALTEQHKYAEAETHLRRAIALKPAAVDAYNNLGIVCLTLGRLEEGERQFRAALRIGPLSVQTLSNLAVALKRSGRLGEAEQYLRQALQVNPRDVGSLTNLGDLLNGRGQSEEALKLLSEAVHLDPNCAEAHNNLAVALKEVGRGAEATPHLEQALRLKPDYTPALNNLGNDLVARGQVAAGITRFQRVLALEPNNVPAWYALATSTNHRFSPAEVEQLRALLGGAGFHAARAGWKPAPLEDSAELIHFALATVLDKQGAADEAFAHALAANQSKKSANRRRGLDFDRRTHRALIDDLHEVFTTESFDRLPTSGLQCEEPVFIVGMPRSGTTLVEQILASHPHVFGAGELDDILEMTAELARLAPDAGGYPRSLARIEPSQLRQLAERQRARLRRLGGDAARVIDKTTINFLHLGFIHLLFPKARIIHCRRDPLDTCLSCFIHNFASQGLHFTFDLQDLGFYYRHYERLMEHWRRVLPAPLFEIPYEELVRDQEKWTRSLLNFCGLDWNDRCLAFHETDRAVKTASALQVRQPMYTKSIGRWKQYEKHLQPLLDALQTETAEALPPRQMDDDLLKRGILLHQGGKFADARACYLQVLDKHLDHPEALHLLGVLEHQAGRNETGLAYIQRAIAKKGDDASYFANLGLVLHALKRTDEAIAALERALQLKPEYALAHKNLAVLHGDACRFDRAEECWRRLVALQPREVGHWRSLGGVLAKQGRQVEAVAAYREALGCNPAEADVHNNLGVTLKEMEQFAESEASYRTALRLRPDFAEVHNNLGILLAHLERHAEALACFEEALRLKPAYADARHNRGAALAALQRHAEAIEDFRAARALNPTEAEVHNSLGASLQVLGRIEEALLCYEAALARDPQHGWAHFNRSQAWLLLGRWNEGWPEWEWRWQRPGNTPRSSSLPTWTGAPLPDGSVVLYSEQGLGDTLQFIRFAPLVKERVGRVIVECQEALAPLMRLIPGIDHVMPKGHSSNADAQAALMSLPALFHAQPDSIPGVVPYLCAAPELVEQWRQRLAEHRGLKVGIAWQGNPRYKRDRFRSLSLTEFAPLAHTPKVTLISLQQGPGREQLFESARPFPVVDLGADIDDAAGAFMDTAAIMMNLDLVISSDTSIPHLAGGLGVPVWMAVSSSPDWRWLLERHDSPWYPSMRLFRQRQAGDWSNVFARMADELRRLVLGAFHPSAESEEV